MAHDLRIKFIIHHLLLVMNRSGTAHALTEDHQAISSCFNRDKIGSTVASRRNKVLAKPSVAVYLNLEL